MPENWLLLFQAVKSLLLNGADPSLRSNGNKFSALHEAVAGGHADIVKLLIEHEVNQLLLDEGGNTALHLACKMNNITIAGLLMKGYPGKKALQTSNKKGLKPIDLCESNLLITKVESKLQPPFNLCNFTSQCADAMKIFLIFLKRREALF